jgi:hypothetical protein
MACYSSIQSILYSQKPTRRSLCTISSIIQSRSTPRDAVGHGWCDHVHKMGRCLRRSCKHEIFILAKSSMRASCQLPWQCLQVGKLASDHGKISSTTNDTQNMILPFDVMAGCDTTSSFGLWQVSSSDPPFLLVRFDGIAGLDLEVLVGGVNPVVSNTM